MNLNKEFLSEVIKYLISKGVTVHDVLDAFHAQFEYHEQNISRQEELRKPLTDIDIALCAREIEKQGFNVEPEPEPKENPAPLNISLSPNTRDYPTSIIPRGKGVSKARKMLFEVVDGKTVLEHLKANNIDYKLFDTRIRKNWSMEKACTTPLTRVVQPYTKSKKPVEKAAPVIESDNVKVVEESAPKTKMMLVNGRMTEMKVSDTDLVQSDIEIPVETLETKTETLETESNTEKATENVTIEPQAESDTDTGENNADAYSDAICEELHETDSDKIEKRADQAVRDIVTGKNKEKKKAEPKKDYAVSDLCFKLNVTTHELREMVNSGEFPQPDRGNKWSAKLLKGKI